MSQPEKVFPKNLLSPEELQLFKKLNTPAKIQDFLKKIPYNEKDTVQSVRRSLLRKKAHCFEGALIASAILWYHGEPPLLLDLRTTIDDDDHVLALYEKNGYWGAISATHHAILRFRDPVYKNLRELAMSYFNEYFLYSGIKTMRGFSKKPFSLLKYGNDWLFSKEELYEIGGDLDDSPHEEIAPPGNMKKLRRADFIERKAANFE